jgi:hypothetical protein
VYVFPEESEFLLYRNNIAKGRRQCYVYEKENSGVGDENEYDNKKRD